MNNETETIADHLLIGNCRTAALVSKSGSINWCCIPEFHSPSIFAALLDHEKGGFFLVQPVNEFQSSQSYLPDTNIGELLFETAEGSARLADCFVAMEEKEKQAGLFPDHEILRMAEGLSGSVKLRFEYRPRVYYGKHAVKLKNYQKLGIHFGYRENICVFQTTLEEVIIDRNGERAYGEFLLNKGDLVIFSIGCSNQHPAIIAEIKTTARKRFDGTVHYWRNWISRCKYRGPFDRLVRRSALTLKLLTHASSGAIIAAPTTSLPESPGGVRNWDYRFCWLRDASFTVRVLIQLGYYEEAHAYMSWILHATRLTQPELQVVYTVFGNARIREKECGWLKGYKGSRPVRVGNEAHDQFQLDVYGEVLDAVYTYSGIIPGFDRGTKRFIIKLGRTICRCWKEPDEGIWEIRSAARHHTHSKVMAWVGLDRLISLCEKYGWKDAPRELFEKTRQLIQRSIEESGFNRELNSYVSEIGGNRLDAALLILPLVDYCAADSPAMRGTVQRIREQLASHQFVYRNLDADDGLLGREGAFVVASFWLVEGLAKMGNLEEAKALLKAVVGKMPSHGLIAEEIEPASGEWLGNYPQGFSHIGLINAALTIDEMEKLQPS